MVVRGKDFSAKGGGITTDEPYNLLSQMHGAEENGKIKVENWKPENRNLKKANTEICSKL